MKKKKDKVHKRTTMSIISQEGCLPFGPSTPSAHLLLALYLAAQQSSSLLSTQSL